MYKRQDEDFLYKLFGVDAELLIDQAWGREPVTIGDIKSYKAKTNCLTCGQVLGCGYSFEDGKLIVKEMMDLLCLEMVEKNLVSNSVTLYVGYSNRTEAEPSRGTASLDTQTNADMVLIPAVTALYESCLLYTSCQFLSYGDYRIHAGAFHPFCP